MSLTLGEVVHSRGFIFFRCLSTRKQVALSSLLADDRLNHKTLKCEMLELGLTSQLQRASCFRVGWFSDYPRGPRGTLHQEIEEEVLLRGAMKANNVASSYDVNQNDSECVSQSQAILLSSLPLISSFLGTPPSSGPYDHI